MGDAQTRCVCVLRCRAGDQVVRWEEARGLGVGRGSDASWELEEGKTCKGWIEDRQDDGWKMCLGGCVCVCVCAWCACVCVEVKVQSRAAWPDMTCTCNCGGPAEREQGIGRQP